MSTQTAHPAELLFREDLCGGDYAAGEDRGYWSQAGLDWPIAFFTVRAATRPEAPDHYAFRFDVHNYPQIPTAQPWELGANAALAPVLWPGGGPRVESAFNPAWRADALYVPMDRLAIEGHHDWPIKYAAHLWDPARDVSQYLRLIYDLLHDETYRGLRGI